MAERDREDALVPPEISYDLWESQDSGWRAAPADTVESAWPEPVEWSDLQTWLVKPAQPAPVTESGPVPSQPEPVAAPAPPLPVAERRTVTVQEPWRPPAPAGDDLPEATQYDGMRHLAVLGGLAGAPSDDVAPAGDPGLAAGDRGLGPSSWAGRWRELNPSRRAEVALVGFLATVAVAVVALVIAGHGGDEIKPTQTLGPRPTIASIAGLNLDTVPATTTSVLPTTTTELPPDDLAALETAPSAPVTAGRGTTPTTRAAARPAATQAPATQAPASTPPATDPPVTAPPSTQPAPTSPATIERPDWQTPPRPTPSFTTPSITMPTLPPRSFNPRQPGF